MSRVDKYWFSSIDSAHLEMGSAHRQLNKRKLMFLSLFKLKYNVSESKMSSVSLIYRVESQAYTCKRSIPSTGVKNDILDSACTGHKGVQIGCDSTRVRHNHHEFRNPNTFIGRRGHCHVRPRSTGVDMGKKNIT